MNRNCVGAVDDQCGVVRDCAVADGAGGATVSNLQRARVNRGDAGVGIRPGKNLCARAKLGQGDAIAGSIGDDAGEIAVVAGEADFDTRLAAAREVRNDGAGSIQRSHREISRRSARPTEALIEQFHRAVDCDVCPLERSRGAADRDAATSIHDGAGDAVHDDGSSKGGIVIAELHRVAGIGRIDGKRAGAMKASVEEDVLVGAGRIRHRVLVDRRRACDRERASKRDECRVVGLAVVKQRRTAVQRDCSTVPHSMGCRVRQNQSRTAGHGGWRIIPRGVEQIESAGI